MKKATARKEKAQPLALVPAEPLRLDFGCGPHKREGFKGVDAIEFVGVDYVVDIRKTPWPWADNSVAEAHASHFVEHLTKEERVQFYNELYRVLEPGGKCQIIVPHWSSERAYGDPTHEWPPVVGFSLYYLNRTWRSLNAPHDDIAVNPNGFTCNFDSTGGFVMHGEIAKRNVEFQQFALQWYKEAAQDMIATLIKA